MFISLHSNKKTNNKHVNYIVIEPTTRNDTKSERENVEIQSEETHFDSRLVVGGIAGVLGLNIIISYIYSNYISINDFYRVGALFAASVNIVDTFSDALFAINISNQSEYPSTILNVLLALSVVFIICPAAITLYQLYKAMNKWKNNDDLGQWLSDYATILYIVSVLTGSSFTGVGFCVSNLYNLPQCDMPLSKMQLSQFQTKRVYSTVLLEVKICKCIKKELICKVLGCFLLLQIEHSSANYPNGIYFITRHSRIKWYSSLCSNGIFYIIYNNINFIIIVTTKYYKINRLCIN